MNIRQRVHSDEQYGLLLGHSTPMKQVFTQIKKARTVDVPVLLLGETGTGKDLAAQTIHTYSERNQGPYVPVNLSALPTSIIASELFGHERGSFTGAVNQRKGKFEQAKNGSLFLDEIESIDQKTQVSLLRVLEDRKFYRLGGKRQISTNARLIAASNENLKQLVDQGTFREDLYYRLEIFPINLPPLRDRKEDISVLISAFLNKANQRLKKHVTTIHDECLRALEEYEWPGNVRELKNVLQRAVLFCEGEELTLEHFPAQFRTGEFSSPSITINIGTPLHEVERRMILCALEHAGDNRTQAAKLLGITRRAIYNKLKKHNLA